MTDVFDALSHPARRQLASELRDGGRRAGDLGVGLTMTREAVSKHLRLMAASGLVVVEVRGRERWYALNTDALREVDAWLTPYRAFWEQSLDALSTEVARGKAARRRSSSVPSTPSQQRGA